VTDSGGEGDMRRCERENFLVDKHCSKKEKCDDDDDTVCVI
jgi:hypothetical protein